MFKRGDRVAYVNSPGQPWVDEFRDNKGNPAIAEVKHISNYDWVHATVVTGPKKGAEVVFLDSEIVPSMKILHVKRSTQDVGLKVYGKVQGESGNIYNFGYIRRQGFRGWICSCEDFFFNRVGKNQNCKHLHFVRGQVGRYAASIQKGEK